jgi:hypothetical protein
LGSGDQRGTCDTPPSLSSTPSPPSSTPSPPSSSGAGAGARQHPLTGLRQHPLTGLEYLLLGHDDAYDADGGVRVSAGGGVRVSAGGGGSSSGGARSASPSGSSSGAHSPTGPTIPTLASMRANAVLASNDPNNILRKLATKRTPMHGGPHPPSPGKAAAELDRAVSLLESTFDSARKPWVSPREQQAGDPPPAPPAPGAHVHRHGRTCVASDLGTRTLYYSRACVYRFQSSHFPDLKVRRV